MWLATLKKHNIIPVIMIILCLTAAFLPASVGAVMGTIRTVPITKLRSDKLALTVNVYENTDIDTLAAALGENKVTFFISEEFSDLHADKVKWLALSGHGIGILEKDLSSLSQKEINDRLAERIEQLAFLTGKNTDLVRFDNINPDTYSIGAVFSLGLFAVQWSADESKKHFSAGDIILVTEKADITSVLKKITADGYETIAVSGKLLS